MGKRERRRKRERARAAKERRAASAPKIAEFPVHAPRIRVVLTAGQPQEVQDLALLYWEFTEAGKWARTVESIGDPQWVVATVTSASHATLLNSLCTQCEEPIRVPNRSWAARVAGSRLDRPNSTYTCPDCSAVREQEQQQERKRRAEAARAEQERQREQAEERARKISKAFDDEEVKDGTDRALPPPSSPGFALYIALANHAAYRPNKPLPSMDDLRPLGWTGDADSDVTALRDLYHGGLIALSRKSPEDCLEISDEDDSVSFFVSPARWRLTGEAATRASTVREITQYLMTGGGQAAHEARRILADRIEHMEIIDVMAYLDELLEDRYGYPAVPETRRQELAENIALGFISGYTPGQMICFAWRAADTAAGWKERNALMGPPEASSAAVTILRGKIEKAVEVRHAIPEYDSPRWHQQPVALLTLRKLNADVKRVFDRSVIDACPDCDHQGWRDADAETLTRCVHLPASTSGEPTVTSDVDDTPVPPDF
ncbi:hypothetical protein ACFOY4_40855 [Actinomadura syzygii]|uniref:hypothetical protein n=1 Tax=Actinomadura syzygii TaxID=1427538 RepID=UPI0016522EAD|nr:hypothetical protein [Actinomadura syzygii]